MRKIITIKTQKYEIEEIDGLEFSDSDDIDFETIIDKIIDRIKNEETNKDGEKFVMTTEGELDVEGDFVYLSYDETEITGMEGSKTRIEFSKEAPGIITMTRSGSVTTVLVFEQYKRHICVYQTPYMPFEVCVNTMIVDNKLLSDGKIYLDYMVELRGAGIEHNKLTLEIKDDVVGTDSISD